MTETITLEIPTDLADSIIAYSDKLTDLFGMNGFGPGNPLYHLKNYIHQGKVNLELEKAKNIKPDFETVVCPIEASTKFHDCWILHKPSKKVYYAPFGHHHQLIEYLLTKHPGVIDETWTKSDTVAPAIRTGDVKHGAPRTANENPVTSKKLQPVLVNAYNAARGIGV